MRTLSVSFARGEVSPLLRARVDMTFYNVALAKLKNMIVLPQGTLARRPGFLPVSGTLPRDTGENLDIRLIPFIYNSEDAMVLALTDRSAQVWLPSTGDVAASLASPYAGKDLRDVKYIQDGNALFLTHGDYPIKLLRRKALDDWEFSDLEYKKGPWSDKDVSDIKTRAVKSGSGWRIEADGSCFAEGMKGRLFRLTYPVTGSGHDFEIEGGGSSGPYEVGGRWRFQASGDWAGIARVQRSLDDGESWMTINEHSSRMIHEADLDIDYYNGAVDWSGAETEDDVLYRVTGEGLSGETPLQGHFAALGYEKAKYFRITEILSPTAANADIELGRHEREGSIPPVWTLAWDLGAWGGSAGYPRCAAFYQERLVLAGSREQPRTVWFSRTGQYEDFGEYDPITDDSPINVTMAGGDLDGIHSLLAMTDILAFTGDGEWKISGAGENGALSPLAVTAHRQGDVGSRPIQPIIVDSSAVMVQTMGTAVYAERYSFELDGYQGSNLSILSGHLFEWKTDRGLAPSDRRIRRMAYQKIPDSLLWFVLGDGTAVTCTFWPEHDMTAWARQETDGFIEDVCCIPRDGHDELWAAVRRRGTWKMERLARRADESVFTDAGGYPYESVIETLRINLESQNGSMMAGKKFIPRLFVFALRSDRALVSPKSDRRGSRERTLEFEYDSEIGEAELMLDSGFERDAGVRLRAIGDEPLTVLALSPVVAVGG
jgi:hypothetical protein